MSAVFTNLKNLARAHRAVDNFVKRTTAKPLSRTNVLLRGRPESTDNVGRTKFLTLPVEAAIQVLQKLTKIDNQRNEEARLPKATYLDSLDLPQAVYALAYVEEEGQLFILDGNTRKLRLFSRRLADFFRELHFVVHFYATKADALRAYHAYDSKQARKSGRNEIEGSFRVSGYAPEKFTSPSLKTGAVVTVVKNLARACYGSTNREREERIIQVYAPYFQALDNVMLEERNPPAGALMAAVMLMETPAAAGLWEYVRDYLRGIKVAHTTGKTKEIPAEFFIKLKARAEHVCRVKGYGTSGETPCKLMAPVYVTCFGDYLERRALQDRSRRLLTRQLSTEILQISSMLKEELADKVSDKGFKLAA